MDKTSRTSGANASVTATTLLLNQKLGTSPAPRMLTPSEIGLLRKSQQEIVGYVRKTLKAV